MEKEFKEYKLSNENGLLIIEDIHSLLKDTYWAAGISKETIKKSIEGSINFGVYLNNKQVGFARIITDQATFAWICDVIIDQSHRGKGLSKQLMAMMMWYLEEKKLRRICLATKDAHKLYEQFGFQIIDQPEMWMRYKLTRN